MRSATQRHLTDLYGTYLCRVVQNKSKEGGTSSQCWIAYEIWLVLLEPSSRPLSANCLYLWIEVGGGARVNDTDTMMIFSERGMFSASFNAKTNAVWWMLRACPTLFWLVLNHSTRIYPYRSVRWHCVTLHT